MKQAWLGWVVTILFGALSLVQALRFGLLGLPLQIPLLALAAVGLLGGLLPSLKSLQHRLMFIAAYGSAFLFLWATGRPGAPPRDSVFWAASASLLVVLVAIVGWLQWEATHRKWSWSFVLAVAFGLFIAYASGPGGGPGWMHAFFLQLFGEGNREAADLAVLLVRKSLHFCGYGAAAFCAAWAAWRQGADRRISVLAGYGWCLPISVFDEWNQTFAGNRTGSGWDVLLDMAGMTVFLWLFWWLRRGDGAGGAVV